MRALVIGLVGVVTACSDGWPDLDPVAGGGIVNPRLGTVVDQSTGRFRVAPIFHESGLVLIYEEDIAGWQAQRLDAATGEATTLTPPPLMPRETFMLGRAVAPEQAVLGIVRDGVISFLLLAEGAESWRTVDGPTQVTIVDPASIEQLLVHDGRMYAVIAGRIFVHSAGAWSEPTTSSSTFVLGGFDSQRQWVLTQGANLPLTAVPIDASGVAGPAVVGTDRVAPVASAVNGNADRFQVIADAHTFVVTPTAITRITDQVPGEAFAAPGSESILVASFDGLGGVRRFTAGVPGELELPAFPQDLDGRHLDYLAVRGSPDAQQIALVIGSDTDGYAVLSVRILELPYASDPFALE